MRLPSVHLSRLLPVTLQGFRGDAIVFHDLYSAIRDFTLFEQWQLNFDGELLRRQTDVCLLGRGKVALIQIFKACQIIV